MSPTRRREAAEKVQEKLGVSERRACETLGQSRSTQRYEARRPEDEERLVAEMLELVRIHPRYGYRMIWGLLRRGGWRVNRKRVWRLWKREGLKVPRKQGKKRRLGSSENGCARRRAERKDHVWAWDFIHDRTVDGRPLKWLSVVDEYTRECLAIDVARSLKSEDVMCRLVELFVDRGVPDYIRSDNGPEFTADAVTEWLDHLQVDTLFIEPGSPWENGYVESFNGKLRDEFLNRELLDTLLEAKVLTERWRRYYNEDRPHSSLGYRAPAPEAREGFPALFATLRSQESPLRVKEQ